MTRSASVLFVCVVHGALIACGGDSEHEPAGKWNGERPHFSIQGYLNGEELALSIEGDDVADGTSIWCEREYRAPLVDGEPDLSQAVHAETTIGGYATVEGEERSFELELLGHALQNDEPGTAVRIVPRVDDMEPESDQMWLEWEWTTIDGEDLLEAAAQEGSFVLHQFSGMPGEGGIVIPEGEGYVGGYAEARWSVDERLSISFTVLCTENEVEEF